ncbi:disease resistance protein RPV1-like [Telopea speciosissima]|uniref:disease resistance protein RPV1-like n=1 Tax=Telopea speciosissima TaxID=54955 RepID=UPI001CC6D8C0|nr:disease resistance protein RPV1-like [Telopea speciosissima]
MPNLRLLQVDNATLEGDIQCLPSELRWFRWWGCPLKQIPADFCHEDLVMLDLTNGLFSQAWSNWAENENKLFQQLEVLQLRCCSVLSELPNFSGFPHLKRLDLSFCMKWVNLHESIGEHQQLVYLNLLACISLEKLPNSIGRLSSLQMFNLRECNSLKELPESIVDLKESLVELSLNGTKIEVLPDGVALLKKLEVLDISSNRALMYLPGSMEKMTSLCHLILCRPDNPLCIPKLPFSLIEFTVSGTQLGSLPDVHNMKNMKVLVLGDFWAKVEQFRGFMKTRNDELSSQVDRHCVLTNCRKQKQSQETFLLGSIENWRRIWIPLQKTDEEEGPNCYLIPDDDEICRCWLMMKLSLSVSIIGNPQLYVVLRDELTLRFKACFSSKDIKMDCENNLRIEGIKKLTGNWTTEDEDIWESTWKELTSEEEEERTNEMSDEEGELFTVSSYEEEEV